MKKRSSIEERLFLAAIILSILLFVVQDLKLDNRGNNTIPILLYHSVDKDQSGIVTITQDKFREQMCILKEEGYTTLSIEEFYACYTGEMKKPNKCVLITFDDGYKDNYTYAYPILKELNFKAVVFTITKYSKRSGSAFLNEAELKELDKNGVSIESHTENHLPLTSESYEQQIETIVQAKEYLQKLLGREVKYIAYPYGRYNDDTLKAVKTAGYSMAFTAPNIEFHRKENKLSIKRIHIGQTYSSEAFKTLIK